MPSFSSGPARSGEVSGEEYSGPDANEHALYEPGHAGRLARPDHRLRHCAGVSWGTLAAGSSFVRGTQDGGSQSAGAYRAGDRPADGRDPWRVVHTSKKAAPGQTTCGGICQSAKATIRTNDAQFLA